MFVEEIYGQHYEERMEEQNRLKRKGSLCKEAREKRGSWCAFSSGEDCCEKKRACDAKRKMGVEQNWEEVEMGLMLMLMARWHFLVQVMNETI